MSKIRKVTLGKDKLIDRWSVLIEDAQGKGDEVIKKTVEFIEESKAPSVKTETVRVFPPGVPKFLSGVFKSIHESGRDYLMVMNEDMVTVRLYVGAQDYGKNLYVAWYLTSEAGLLDLLSFALRGERGKQWPGTENLFMEEQLNAYVTCIHHCVLKTVEVLMLNLGQDFSKVERKSKGFLGVS